MKRILGVALAVGTLFTGVAAGATDEDAFLGVLKKYGVTESGATSRKPCLCSGGSLDRYVGVLVTSLNNGDNGYFQFDCALPSFNSDGARDGGASCLNSGGAVVALPK